MNPTYEDISSCDLRFELAAAGEDLRYYREHGDHATAVLMLAWIDALLDEWNRRDRRR